MRQTLTTALVLGTLLGTPLAETQAPAAPGAAAAVPLGQPLEARHLAAHRVQSRELAAV